VESRDSFFRMATLSTSGLLRVGRVLSFPPGTGGTAIWWQDGRIQAVGGAAEVSRKVPPGTPEFDFPAGLATPGFVDSHTHFAMSALGRGQAQLAGAGTAAEAVDRVAKVTPLDGWVQGQGWDANGWETPPHRGLLDPVQAVPVFLHSLDVHAAWVNSAALQAAGIDPGTPDPFGGRIARDAAGQPTGLLLERAVDLVRRILPEPPSDRLVSSLLLAQAEAHRLGITGIHDVEDSRAYQAFRLMEAEDRLRLRVLFHHPVADLPRLVASGIRSGAGGKWLTEGGIKLFLDGSLGSRTAWMLQPYEGTRDRGMPISQVETAREAMVLAATSGLASVVHAIGDAAVRRALDLIEDLPATAIRHRIEHFQCVDPADLDRAARHRIALSMQPAHILTDIPLAERHWGKRSQGAYVFRSLLGRGSLLAFGSDTPVASLDPREGVYAAMERRMDDQAPSWNPDERLDFETVVRAYTEGPAMAGGLATTRGRLAPGYDADLVVWDLAEPDLPITGTGFRHARVALTIAGGEAVYTSPFAQ
jgi:predicted amidohydrolase YtcJ